jgi:hypothetical protein
MKNVVGGIIATLAVAIGSTEAATLPAFSVIGPGQTLSSDDGLYYLVMQPSDGHLVLYRNSDGKPIWYTGKPGGANAWAVLQGDRNLVVYRQGPGIPSNAAWASNTGVSFADPGAYMTVRNNGALYLHTSTGKIYWSTPVDPMAFTGCMPNAPTNYYPICTRPGTRYQRTSAQPACSWENAAEILTHTINDGAVMGPCE